MHHDRRYMYTISERNIESNYKRLLLPLDQEFRCSCIQLYSITSAPGL